MTPAEFMLGMSKDIIFIQKVQNVPAYNMFLYMQTCCTHRIYNHSVVNVCGMSGELQVSNNENVFKCPSSWSGKIPRSTQIPDT